MLRAATSIEITNYHPRSSLIKQRQTNNITICLLPRSLSSFRVFNFSKNGGTFASFEFPRFPKVAVTSSSRFERNYLRARSSSAQERVVYILRICRRPLNHQPARWLWNVQRKCYLTDCPSTGKDFDLKGRYFLALRVTMAPRGACVLRWVCWRSSAAQPAASSEEEVLHRPARRRRPPCLLLSFQ